MGQVDKAKIVKTLRTLADEIEAGKKPLGVLVAWILETEPNQLSQQGFRIEQNITKLTQINAWRCEASRLMRLMDQLDASIREHTPEPTLN